MDDIILLSNSVAPACVLFHRLLHAEQTLFMSHLSLNLLGGFEVTRDAEPVTGFRTDKVRALLAFLAVESSRPHRRSVLAAMFWPEATEQNAGHNLSQSLVQLRRVLGETKKADPAPFLLVTPRALQFNENSDYQLDVGRFRHLLGLIDRHVHSDGAGCETCQAWREQAAELYRGDLLAGLYVSDSTAFEEWRTVLQEDLRQQALELFRSLSTFYEKRGKLERAQEYSRRQIALDPWQEEAHIQLMRLMVQNGQAAAALKQFESFRQRLAEELGLEPSAEMMRFYETIRSGTNPVKTAEVESSWLAGQGEQRQVTTLVCSRRLLEEGEDLAEQAGVCERFCEPIFSRFGGRRAPRQGATCLVYFGYPQAYEDAARRAVHSGLAMIKTGSADGEPARIGIHTGAIMIGEMHGPRWQDRDLTGVALEVARDCQRQAGPGQVVITADTRRLLQDSFLLEAVDTPIFKLTGEPVSLYLVRGETDLQNWLAGTQRQTSFVGRAAEINLLKASYEKVLRGRGQIVLVSGEPGIGKSRLLRELKGETGIPWLVARCQPHLQNNSLSPLIGILEQLLGFETVDSPETRLEKLSGALAWYDLQRPSAVWSLSLLLGLPTQTPPPEVITKAQREQMRQLLMTLLQKRSAQQPFVLVIEDIHWSDPSTVEWISHSLGFLANIPCLTVLTARPAFDPARLMTKEGQSGLLRLVLNPLPVEQVEDMVTQLVGDSRFEEIYRRHIIDHTDGVPLFVEEMTKMLLERPGLRNASSPGAGIPVSLRDSLAARLDFLGQAKETAQWAAVQGREFNMAVLRACVPYDHSRLETDILRLIEAELIAPLPRTSTDPRYSQGDDLVSNKKSKKAGVQNRYQFKHALIQEVAYASMLRGHRQEVHRQIAKVLEEKSSQDAVTQPEILAQHFANSGSSSKAVEYWLLAGDLAIAKGATLEAHNFFENALANARLVPESEQGSVAVARCQLALGHLLRLRGEYDSALLQLEAARSAYAALDDRARLSQALAEIGIIHVFKADYPAAQMFLEESLDLARAVDDRVGMAQAINYLGTTAYYQSDYARARQCYEESLELRKALGDQRAIANSLNNIGLLATAQGDFDTARQRHEESLALRRKLGNKQGIADSLNNLGVLAENLRDYRAARTYYEESLDLCREIDDKWQIALLLSNLGSVAANLGDYSTAEKMLDESLSLKRDMSDKRGIAVSTCLLGDIKLRQSQISAAETYYKNSQSLAQEIGEKHYQNLARLGLGFVALTQGEFQTAQQSLLECLKILNEIGDEANSIEALIGLADVFTCLGEELRAAKILGATQEMLDGKVQFLLTSRPYYDQAIDSARAALGEAAYEAACREGSQMKVEDVIALAEEARGY
jgi:DNA-binding SARP family transcriptional activator/class 3 adenylate cyclase